MPYSSRMTRSRRFHALCVVLTAAAIASWPLPSPAGSASKGKTVGGRGCTASMVFVETPTEAVRAHVPAPFTIREPGAPGMTMVMAGIYACEQLHVSKQDVGPGAVSFAWIPIEPPSSEPSPGGGDLYELWRVTDSERLGSFLSSRGHDSPVVPGMDIALSPVGGGTERVDWTVPWGGEGYEAHGVTTGEVDPHDGVAVRVWHHDGSRSLRQDIVETAGPDATANEARGAFSADPGSALSSMLANRVPATMFVFTDRDFTSVVTRS